MSGWPPNRPKSSPRTRPVASSSAPRVPKCWPQYLQRIISQRGTGAAQRGQLVRSGASLGTDSRKTALRSTAPAGTPATRPSAAHTALMAVHRRHQAGPTEAPPARTAWSGGAVSADRPTCRAIGRIFMAVRPVSLAGSWPPRFPDWAALCRLAGAGITHRRTSFKEFRDAELLRGAGELPLAAAGPGRARRDRRRVRADGGADRRRHRRRRHPYGNDARRPLRYRHGLPVEKSGPTGRA